MWNDQKERLRVWLHQEYGSELWEACWETNFRFVETWSRARARRKKKACKWQGNPTCASWAHASRLISDKVWCSWRLASNSVSTSRRSATIHSCFDCKIRSHWSECEKRIRLACSLSGWVTSSHRSDQFLYCWARTTPTFRSELWDYHAMGRKPWPDSCRWVPDFAYPADPTALRPILQRTQCLVQPIRWLSSPRPWSSTAHAAAFSR